ncbi:MAG: sulfotransferase [Thermomonas sp.]|uniref:sulfotransferase family protein n=1 Tax=Thermomonas sp. TaxID=1971895 RepID=UPI001ECB21D3|nr:hypothetical protein [Thermomonas sp.]MBV2208674.1 sulfotransferase [Thermomonas sp.]
MSGNTAIALLIVGMHRSGTSAVAGSLARLGMPLGERLLAAGEDNPKGYFEHEDAVRLNDALLDGLNRSWDDPRNLPDDWMQMPAADEARIAIDRLLGRDFSGVALFALKDPRMCRLLPLWLEVLRAANVEPRVLLVVRHPFEVAASLSKRNAFAPALSEILWLEHMLAAERDSRDCRRAVLSYDELMAAPQDALRHVASVLDLDGFCALRGGALSEFVSANDRHFSGGTLLSPGSDYDDIAVDAFKLFTQLPLDVSDFDALQARLSLKVSSALELVNALAAHALQSKREAATGMEAFSRLESQLNAQIAWSNAAVVEREALQVELAETRSSLNAQIAWSNAAVVEREALQAELAKMCSVLAAQTKRAANLELTISRYEATLIGRLQRRWLMWCGNRRNGKKTNKDTMQ